MVAGPLEYLGDIWNCIDATSIGLNTMFLALFTTNQVYKDVVYSAQTINTIGAFCQFFMWVKVFYWMRLFPSLAYYVKLIQKTISDCSPF